VADKPERRREYNRRYYEENLETLKAQSRDKYQANEAYRNRTRERTIIRNREQRRQLRQKAFDLLGRLCIRCGFSDERALQVDHINGGGTEEARRLGPWKLAKRIIEHPEDYQILCANCNWIKRHEQNEQPSGPPRQFA